MWAIITPEILAEFVYPGFGFVWVLGFVLLEESY